MKHEFSDILTIDEIGITISNNPIYSLSFKLNPSSTGGMLFTGIHHAREPVSLMMNIYLIFKILFEISIGNVEYEELVLTRNIHFIPLINVDGYQYNVILFDSINGNEFGMVRKNRRGGPEFSYCEG